VRKAHISTKQFDSNNDVLTDNNDDDVDDEEDDDVLEGDGVRRYACCDVGRATSGPNPNQDVIDQVRAASMSVTGLRPKHSAHSQLQRLVKIYETMQDGRFQALQTRKGRRSYHHYK